MPTLLFDIRVEVGKHGNVFYAKTILGQNGMVMDGIGADIGSAIQMLAFNLEKAGVIQSLVNTPSTSDWFLQQYKASRPPQAVPVGTTSAPSYPTGPNNASNTAGPRKQWSDLTGVPRPTCETQCIVYDNFAGKKCHSFCPHKR